MTRSLEPGVRENLGQQGREAKPAAAEYFGRTAEQSFERLSASAELGQAGFRAEEWRLQFGKFSPGQRDPPLLDRPPQGGERFRGISSHRFQGFARQDEIRGGGMGDLVAERRANRRRCDECQIEKVCFDGIEILASFREEVKGAGQLRGGGLAVALEPFFGRRKRVSAEGDFVEVAHIAELSREQFDNQMAIAKRQEIAGQLRIARRKFEAADCLGHDLVSRAAPTNHHGSAGARRIEPSLGQSVLAAGVEPRRDARRAAMVGFRSPP